MITAIRVIPKLSGGQRHLALITSDADGGNVRVECCGAALDEVRKLLQDAGAKVYVPATQKPDSGGE